jgi:hypothetical protein
MSQARISREASWLRLSAQSLSKKQRRIFMSKVWLITGSGNGLEGTSPRRRWPQGTAW